MGNKNPDEKDINSYIREGWHFRIKTVKGRKYITRRKGQMERGIGPYNPDLWGSITQLVSQVATDKKYLIKTRPLSNKNSNERKVCTSSFTFNFLTMLITIGELVPPTITPSNIPSIKLMLKINCDK